MWRNGSAGQLDFTYATGGYTYYVNVCGQTVYSVCMQANGVCQVISQAGYDTARSVAQ